MVWVQVQIHQEAQRALLTPRNLELAELSSEVVALVGRKVPCCEGGGLGCILHQGGARLCELSTCQHATSGWS